MLVFLNMIFSVLLCYIPLINILQVKLKWNEKLTIIFLYIMNVPLYMLIGNLSIYTVLISISIYFVVKNIEPLQSICMLLFSYGLSVMSVNIVSFIFGLAGIANNEIMHSYFTTIVNMGINILVIYKGSYWLGKVIHKIIRRIYLPVRIWIILAINLLIMCIIFAFNIIIGEYMEYSSNVIVFNSILFILFFLSNIISVIILFRVQIVEMENKVKQDSFENLQNYTSKVEKMYADIRIFKHDYINTMISMKGYLEANEFEQLYKYFTCKIEPLGKKIMQSKVQLSQLMNIGVVEIKSLLSSKIIYADEIGIDVRLEILEPVDIKGIDTIQLVIILGIFLDNAIEASSETEKPQVAIIIIRNRASVAIIIKNNYKVHEALAYHDLGKKEVSSKGENRGIGLYNVRQILLDYPNILLDTSYGEQFFEQHLEIME